MRFAAAALLLASVLPLTAATEFRDVNLVDRKDGSLKKADGALWLDRDDAGMVFISEHKPLAMLSYAAIKSIRYDDKNKRTLTIYYENVRGTDKFVMFELKSGNRENLLATLETQSGKPIERVSRK